MRQLHEELTSSAEMWEKELEERLRKIKVVVGEGGRTSGGADGQEGGQCHA